MRSGDLKLLFGDWELLLEGEVIGRKLLFGDIDFFGDPTTYCCSMMVLEMCFAVFFAFF